MIEITISASAATAGVCRDAHAASRRQLRRLLGVIPGDDLEALFGEALRDGAAHTAQPDKPDFH